MSIELDKIVKAEKELKQLEEQYKGLAADASLTAASFAPPPWGTAADVVSIGKSLWSGDWGGALLDTVGLIPVVGDAVKGATKGTKIAAKMDEVADAIKVARAKLTQMKDNLINGSKKNKKELDDAINGCSTKNCANKKNINGPTKTIPTGKKGGKPEGSKSPETGSQKRKHQLENEAAELLAKNGYKVKQNPGTQPNGKNPDYEIEGNIFDCLSPGSSNIDQVRKGISTKVNSGQTDRIVLNLDDSKVSPDNVRDMLNRKPKTGLKEVIGVKDGQITQIFP